MKYKIDGIEDNKVIKSVVVEEDNYNFKTIVITYLDNSVDLVRWTPENSWKIIKAVTMQAKEYVKNKEEKIKNIKENDKTPLILTIDVATMIPLGLSAIGLAGFGTFITTIIIYLASVIALIKEKITVNSKINDLEKYDYYLNDFQKVLEQYNSIIDEELALCNKITPKPEKKKCLTDVTMLDNYSLKELKKIREKVNRYNYLMGNSETNINDNINVEKSKQKIKK